MVMRKLKYIILEIDKKSKEPGKIQIFFFFC